MKGATSTQGYTWLTQCICVFNSPKQKDSEKYSPPAHISKKFVLITSPVLPVEDTHPSLDHLKSNVHYVKQETYPFYYELKTATQLHYTQLHILGNG